MMQQDDPRNMFCAKREEYAQTKQPEKDTNADTYEEKLEQMKKIAQKYQKEGEGQLVRDIVNSVLEQKAAGNLSNEQLVVFAKRVAPLLNAEQKERLDALLDQLLKL